MMHLVSILHGFARRRSVVLNSIQCDVGHPEPTTNPSQAAWVANSLLSALN
jgi:hypothetical protein